MKTFIIAEAGVNHNGSMELAYKLVDAAADAGADAIKFQTFKTEKLVTKKAKQAEYQTENLGESSSQFCMLKKLELSYQQFSELKKYCDEKRIMFLSTPFDMESVDFLIETLGVTLIKVPSGEITNAPYLFRIASHQANVILSTGMATIEEIHESLAFLAYGYSGNKDVTYEKAQKFYQSDHKAKDLLKDKVSILHCTTQYPTPLENINLLAMETIQREFHLPTGLSDHSEGIIAAIGAAAREAAVIEKHFTLDRRLPGPDHKASLEPLELKEMVQSIRSIETALGSLGKNPTEDELKNKAPARKSLVAARKIKKGENFTVDNLTVKRPDNGIPPKYYWDYIGRAASEAYNEDEVIK